MTTIEIDVHTTFGAFIKGVGYNVEEYILRVVMLRKDKGLWFYDFIGPSKADYTAVRNNPGVEFNTRIKGKFLLLDYGPWPVDSSHSGKEQT